MELGSCNKKALWQYFQALPHIIFCKAKYLLEHEQKFYQVFKGKIYCALHMHLLLIPWLLYSPAYLMPESHKSLLGNANSACRVSGPRLEGYMHSAQQFQCRLSVPERGQSQINTDLTEPEAQHPNEKRHDSDAFGEVQL